ncbi:MAG TPA: DUF4252 domain-containing protein [Prolixibacteraceae bacterium]|nr:DUF4252 domain-containing protein [Prolixibacteraceae bacterium]
MQLIHKLGILLAILLSALIGTAQGKSDKLYDMYSGKDGVFTLSFNSSFLKPLEVFVDDDTKEVIMKMKKVRMLFYNEHKGTQNAFDVYERFTSELKGDKYFEIDPEEIDCKNGSIKVESDENLLLIGHGTKNEMDEFHILVNDDNNTMLFSFFGEITINNFKELGRFSKISRKNMVY